jgi:hypothetical protein
MNKYLLITLLVHISIVNAEPTWNNAAERIKKQWIYDGQQYVSNARPDYECGGIVLFDAGAAMDMPIYFAEANPRKFLCSITMGSGISVDPNDTCPPVAWVKSGCEAKHQEGIRKYREKMNLNGTGK